MATFQERGQQILNEHFFSKTSSLTLTFDHVTCISIRVIYSLGVSNVPSLETFKQRGWVKRYWMDIIYTKTSSLTFTFDHVTWNLLLGASTIRSLRSFKQRGQDILSIDITWSTDRLRDLLLLTLIGCPTEQQWIMVEMKTYLSLQDLTPFDHI